MCGLSCSSHAVQDRPVSMLIPRPGAALEGDVDVTLEQKHRVRWLIHLVLCSCLRGCYACFLIGRYLPRGFSVQKDVS